MWYNWMMKMRLKQWKHYLNLIGQNTRVIQTVIFVQEITERSFFDKNRPIFKDYYICAYCGRFLKKKDVTVDHIISIRKAQKSKILQFILRLVKINDINDEKNLTASCETCNKKKGQKLSLSYVLRGILGRKSWYWIIYYIVIIVVLVIVILQIVNPWWRSA